MKIFEWFKKHPIASVAIVGYTVAVIVCGSIMLNSYTSYQRYEKKYNADELELAISRGATPSRVMIEDEYKSKYAEKLRVGANELSINSLDGNNDDKIAEDAQGDAYITGMNNANGGEVSFEFTTDKDAFVDIDIVISSSLQSGDTIAKTENLMKLVSFSVNDARADGDVVLDVDEEDPELNWHRLILKKVPLQAGDSKLVIASVGNNPKQSGVKVMPNIMSVAFYSNAKVSAK